MELANKSRKELLAKCEEYGITNYKSKNKKELIDLLNVTSNTIIKHLKPLIKWSGGKVDEIKMFKSVMTY
jgi:hypothetical protein